MMNHTLPYQNLNFYQNASVEASAIKEGFLTRLYEYSVIISDILRHPMEGSLQHYWVVGERGSGKSTLLRRLQVEIDTHKKLAKTYIAINMAGEQANVYKLYDLLEQVLQELEERDIPVEWPGEEEDEHSYTRKLFAMLHKALERSGKKVILLLDNIDRILDNIGDGDRLLREHLLNYKDIKIIGASTRLTEHFLNYRKPFYEFFGLINLERLTNKGAKELLLGWSEKMDLPQLRDFVEKRPGQLETVRLLTDGQPRTMQFLGNILLWQGGETSYEYLRLLMDRETPLYQERLHNLPPSQRKIVLHMAFLWEAMGAKELARATKMENRLISAQLNQLVGKGVAEKIETRTKNHLYRLSERPFNLWLILTQGGPREKQRVKHLTMFLENFFSEKVVRRPDNKSPEAPYFLSLSYYTFNENKKEAVSLLSNYVRKSPDERSLSLMPVLNCWNGDFTQLEEDVLSLVRQKNSYLNFTLFRLLIHQQINLVENLFKSEEFGPELIEKYLPLYHATRLLSRNTPEVPIKVLPEIQEVVNDLVQQIQEQRAFYHGAT